MSKQYTRPADKKVVSFRWYRLIYLNVVGLAMSKLRNIS